MRPLFGIVHTPIDDFDLNRTYAIAGANKLREPLEYRQTTEYAHYTYTAPRRGRLRLF